MVPTAAASLPQGRSCRGYSDPVAGALQARREPRAGQKTGSAFVVGGGRGTTPVSYTHLDVYKRQDLDSAVEGAMVSKYRNAGQTCVCANRFYVQAGVYDRFVEKLAAKAGGIKLGNGFEAGVNQGPMIDDAAIHKVESHVADALAKGARVVVGGSREGERFYTPTVLADVTGEMLCAKEETFGPVAPVFRFETEAEAIAQANATEFGLASYFYSRDIGRIFRVGEALEYGMVGVNTGLISTAEVPFGGVKHSGLGREGARQGMDDYVELKYLCLGDILA